MAAAVEDQVTSAFMGRLPEAALALQPLGERAKALRLAKYGAAKDPKKEEEDDEMDLYVPAAGVGFVSRAAPTSMEFAERRKRELAKAEDEARAVKQRKDDKEAKKLEREEEENKRKLRAIERAAAAARKKSTDAAAKEMRKAAMAARKAAKGAPKAPAPKEQVKSGKRARVEEQGVYAKEYKKSRK